MFYVPIILGSIRRNRESIKVARFVLRYLKGTRNIDAELLDLRELDLPMMEERLRFRNDAGPNLLEFSAKISRAESILIVTPEYSGGYPGVLKNALDYLRPECKRKPFGIITVSAAMTGGILCLNALRQVVLQMGGVPIPASLMVSKVQEAFDSEGNPADPAFHHKAQAYFDEFLWFTEALATQRAKEAKV
jgi:NAD(P)H-dependent FMN reductase